MENLMITTAVKEKDAMIQLALQLSCEWNVPYIKRQKQTIQQLIKQFGNVLIVYSDKLEYVHEDGTKLFFHPNTAVIRIRQGYDPLSELVGSGKTILDCTMGLAGDSIVMAYYHNHVTAIEYDPIIYTVVKHGLKQFKDVEETVQKAMHRIDCVHDNFSNYLKQQNSDSVDIVYFDPMFSETIKESKNIQGIQSRQKYVALTQDDINEAKRVCKECVMIKAHFRDDVFERFGFQRHVRENTKFHYGVWKKLQ
ncbi:class I SAM-dependent methyltransferase [Carnobacteriaceae bacterium zg-C25]|nr:class I SAM-dependent methyltransferase [Carnobacteriaceae bacterium zg-C25]